MTLQMQICLFRTFQKLCGFDMYSFQLLTSKPQDRINQIWSWPSDSTYFTQRTKELCYVYKLIIGFNLINENYPDSMISAFLHFTHIFKTSMSASEFLIFSLSLLLLYLNKHHLHHLSCLHHIFEDPFVTFFSITSSYCVPPLVLSVIFQNQCESLPALFLLPLSPA